MSNSLKAKVVQQVVDGQQFVTDLCINDGNGGELYLQVRSNSSFNLKKNLMVEVASITVKDESEVIDILIAFSFQWNVSLQAKIFKSWDESYQSLKFLLEQRSDVVRRSKF